MFKSFVLISLLAVLAFLVGNFSHAESTIPEITKKKAATARACLERFKRACGSYPRTDQGLDTLVPSFSEKSGLQCKNYEACKEVMIDPTKAPQNLKEDFRNDGLGYDLIYLSDGKRYELFWSGIDGKLR